MNAFPQVLISVDVKNKPDLDSVPEISRVIEETEKELGKTGRVFVRYSGTQSLCRIMVEGPTEEMTRRCAERVVRVVRKELG